ERTRAGGTARWGDWNVAVQGRATAQTTVLTLPGDQVRPATNGKQVVFRDAAARGLGCSQCVPGVTGPLRGAGDQPALDAAAPGELAWRADGLPASPLLPAGTLS